MCKCTHFLDTCASPCPMNLALYICPSNRNATFQKWRSSRPNVFFKNGVLRNFAKFTGKNLCQSLFLNKVAGLRRATILKKRLCHRCFPVNFAKFLRTPFLIEHLWWPLLKITNQFFLLLCMNLACHKK